MHRSGYYLGRRRWGVTPARWAYPARARSRGTPDRRPTVGLQMSGTPTLAMLVPSRLEGSSARRPGQVIELPDGRRRSVRTTLIRLDAKVERGSIDHLFEQVGTTAAAGAGLWCSFHLSRGYDSPPERATISPCDVVAGADGGGIRQHQGRGAAPASPPAGEQRLFAERPRSW